MNNEQELRQARMSLAQAVTRSYAADGLAECRAVDEHRTAAELRLRRGGREDLGLQIEHDLDPGGTDCRANCREIMSLIDAELELEAEHCDDFATLMLADGGEADE